MARKRRSKSESKGKGQTKAAQKGKTKRKYTTVSIPIPLARKIKERITDTGFSSVSDYVTYVLREVIANLEAEEKEEAFSREEEEKVKERLRALGYLD